MGKKGGLPAVGRRAVDYTCSLEDKKILVYNYVLVYYTAGAIMAVQRATSVCGNEKLLFGPCNSLQQRAVRSGNS